MPWQDLTTRSMAACLRTPTNLLNRRPSQEEPQGEAACQDPVSSRHLPCSNNSNSSMRNIVLSPEVALIPEVTEDLTITDMLPCDDIF